jgi:AraC family transcriptional regulator, regulatory protein of adaptative response / methylphosphotriester-DNA alkyltransferase methyltransferase
MKTRQQSGIATQEMLKDNNTGSLRQKELIAEYLRLLDQHMDALKTGMVERMFTIHDFAERLFVHPRHLSNTINEVLQTSPCDLFEERLLAVAKELILADTTPIAEIARTMTYDPSNFSKFFKRYTGMTPKQFREVYATPPVLDIR